MSRITECHEEREDHVVIQEEGSGEFVSFFVVSDHFVDKGRTQVAEVWMSRYNVEVMVEEMQKWLQNTPPPKTDEFGKPLATH